MKKFLLKLSAAVICFCLIITAVPFSASARTTEIYVSAQSIKNKGTAPAIQQALNLAEKQGADSDNIIKVVVEPGNYELNSSLHIFDNTWLSLYGVTIYRGEKGTTMLRTGYDETESTGVTGYRYRNITIEGGIFDGSLSSETMLKIAHAKNYVMKNVRVQNNKNAHMMEVAGVDGFTAEGCGFYDQIMEVGNVGYEAIQFDVLKYGNIYGCRSEDLAMKNVLVENCVFSNVPRAIGSHTSVHNNPHDTFIIRNNLFKDIGSVAIQTLGWVNCSISNNTIDNAPRAIAVYSIVSEGYGTILPSTLANEGGTEQHFPDEYSPQLTNILISNNIITNGGAVNDKYAGYEKAAVTVMGSKVVNSTEYSGGSGKLPKGDYPCDTVTIKNNLMYLKNGTGLRVEHSKNISIDSNVMFCTQSAAPPNYYGVVFRDGVSSANIIKNYISNAAVNGLMIDSSTVGFISGNEIIGTGKYGIGTYASAIGTIQNNDIRNAKSEGISILNGSNVSTKISENRVSGSASGIHIMANAAAKLIDKNLTYNCKSGLDYTKSSNKVAVGTNYTANAAVSTFTVDNKSLNLNIGDCYRIGKNVVPVNAITNFSFVNSNPAVAVVDNTGRITAKAAGTTNITVKSANGKALIVTVNVAANQKVILGDLDGDGIVTSVDSALLGNYISGIGKSEIFLSNADVTGDGKITAADRIVLSRYVDRLEGYSVLPYKASGKASGSCKISVDSVKASPGEVVEVGINLDENPGIATADLDVEYNSKALKLIEAVDNNLIFKATAAHSEKLNTPYHLSWENDLTTINGRKTGKLVTLKFKVADNPEPGEYRITVNQNTAEVYNCNLKMVPCAFESGNIEILDDKIKKGDVDGNGKVDVDDALLLQKHIAGFTRNGKPIIDEDDGQVKALADVNCDGIISVGDVTQIQQFAAGIISEFITETPVNREKSEAEVGLIEQTQPETIPSEAVTESTESTEPAETEENTTEPITNPTI